MSSSLAAHAPIATVPSARPRTVFTLRRRRDGGDFRIELRGELDVNGVAELEAALTDAEASDAECVVLDLRCLAFMDGAGLRTILIAHHRLTGRRALLLRRGPRAVQRLFEIAEVEGSLFFLD